MPDLAEICTQCRAKYEKSLDNLCQQIKELQEKENCPTNTEPDGRDLLIDLIESDILWQEAHVYEKSEKFKKIVDAYRAIRPK